MGYDTLLKNPMVDATKVALIGYCFGGMVGVEFGSTGAPLATDVAIHGSFAGHPPGWAQNTKGKFLILHGAEDVPYPLEKVAEVYNELRKAKVEFQMEFYSGAGHGFSRRRTRTRSAPTRSRSRQRHASSRTCSTASRLVPDARRDRFLDVLAHRARKDKPLNLRGALVDFQNALVAIEPLR